MAGRTVSWQVVLGLLVVTLLAGCAGTLDDGQGASTEPTANESAVVSDDTVDTEIDALESFVAALEAADVEVVDYGFANEGFVGLVYRYDEATELDEIRTVLEAYRELAIREVWNTDELRVMSIDSDGDPVATYHVETSLAQAAANESITGEEYESRVSRTYEKTDVDAPTPTPADDVDFTFPDEAGDDDASSPPEPTLTPEPASTPTPDDDDGWLIFPGSSDDDRDDEDDEDDQ